MPSSSDLKPATKARLADSSLEDWASFLENAPGEGTSPCTPLCQQGPIGLTSLNRHALVAVSICSALFLLALVAGCILLISWATPAKAGSVTLTAVSLSENDLGIWMARKPFCSALPPCG